MENLGSKVNELPEKRRSLGAADIKDVSQGPPISQRQGLAKNKRGRSLGDFGSYPLETSFPEVQTRPDSPSLVGIRHMRYFSRNYHIVDLSNTEMLDLQSESQTMQNWIQSWRILQEWQRGEAEVVKILQDLFTPESTSIPDSRNSSRENYIGLQERGRGISIGNWKPQQTESFRKSRTSQLSERERRKRLLPSLEVEDPSTSAATDLSLVREFTWYWLSPRSLPRDKWLHSLGNGAQTCRLSVWGSNYIQNQFWNHFEFKVT